jgi:hypothetical protein
MILVTNLFREKSENFKIYRPGSKIAHFSKKREDELIKKKYALRVVEKEKVESKPKRSKKEK